MKKLISMVLIFLILVFSSSYALAMDKQPDAPAYVIKENGPDKIVFKSTPITNDTILLAQAINELNDGPSSNAVRMELNGSLKNLKVLKTTQKIQERITAQGETIGTYATTAYVVHTDGDQLISESQSCLEGYVRMKVRVTFDYFQNSSGQFFNSPKNITYTYVSKESPLENVTWMYLYYKTGTNGYNSNADRVTTTPSSANTSKTNPLPGDSISLTYQYGGTRFFKMGETVIIGSHRWAGGGSLENGIVMYL